MPLKDFWPILHPMVKLKLQVFVMMFFLLKKLNVSAVIVGGSIYQDSFGTFSFKVPLNVNLLHQNE